MNILEVYLLPINIIKHLFKLYDWKCEVFHADEANVRSVWVSELGTSRWLGMLQSRCASITGPWIQNGNRIPKSGEITGPEIFIFYQNFPCDQKYSISCISPLSESPLTVVEDLPTSCMNEACAFSQLTVMSHFQYRGRILHFTVTVFKIHK